jgi:L-asparaginase
LAGVTGIVVAAAGNGSIHETLAGALADAAACGVAVVRSSRTGAGHVAMPGKPVPAVGLFVSAADLNPYKARVAVAGAGERSRAGGRRSACRRVCAH